MQRTRLLRPEYSERFRCIGPECEDSCCQGWSVHIDAPTWAKYQALPAGPLRVLIDEHMQPTPEGDPARVKGCAASIKMSESLACPFHTEERLCRIQVERGHEYLAHVCATFPRVGSNIDNMRENALSLSCPEAARLVLLDRALPSRTFAGLNLDWDDTVDRGRALLPYFWTLREFAVTLAVDRAYPLWQRMFLLGTLARRLEAISTGELRRRVPELLRDLAGAIVDGGLRAAMDRIEPDPALQLDMVLKLGGVGRDRIPNSARFMECMRQFREGIGLEPGATPSRVAARYDEAARQWFAPLMARYPHILENYLVNAIFRRQFPFGLRGGELETEPRPAREYAQLAVQFALVKGLLIGVAGCHRERFSTAHVVHTVQAVSKHFDHLPEFLEEAYALLVRTGRDNAHGLTMLLRNHETVAAQTGQRQLVANAM